MEVCRYEAYTSHDSLLREWKCVSTAHTSHDLLIREWKCVSIKLTLLTGYLKMSMELERFVRSEHTSLVDSCG